MKTTHAHTQILLIEPDVVQATAIQEVFLHEHVRFVVVSGAQAAIAAADQFRPDIVILELALPMHNGVEFLHEFRSYKEWESIPVVIFTQQHVDDPIALTGLGVVKHLYKPRTSLAELKKQVLALRT